MGSGFNTLLGLPQALSEIRPGRRLCVVVLAPLVTVQREFVALHKVPEIQVSSSPATLHNLYQAV